MLVLFDHVTLAGIARVVSRHTVVKAKERGWDRLSNGDLLTQAERAGFDVLLTADKNMRYQQNLAGRRIALIVLSTPQRSWLSGISSSYCNDRFIGAQPQTQWKSRRT